MTYSVSFEKYRKNWTKVEDLRTSGFFQKHLFSLPSQWLKRFYARKVLKKLPDEQDLPYLSEKGTPNIVVSLTTFPARIEKVSLVIRGILKQDVLPERIYLWLTEEEFPEGITSLPAELLELQKYGLEISFVKDNFKAHNKYFYAFQQFPDKIVITVDDDFIYSKDTLSRLVDLHKKFPGAVCANRVREIATQGNEFSTYWSWKRIVPQEDCVHERYIALGYAGVLYPPHMGDNTLLDPETFKKLSPLADDLWLKAVQMTRGIKVANPKGYFVTPISIPGSQKISLNHYNDGHKKNEEQWKKLNNHFNLRNTLSN